MRVRACVRCADLASVASACLYASMCIYIRILHTRAIESVYALVCIRVKKKKRRRRRGRKETERRYASEIAVCS